MAADSPHGDGEASVPVLIAGAGPVGLALAAELGRLGIRCLVVERRDGSVPVPKMSQVSARCMEFCRRWGIADAVRAAGWPKDLPGDIVYLHTMQGVELARLEIPAYAARDRQPFTPESPCHCPQIFFDPILADHVETLAPVELRYETELVGFTQDAESVTATLRDVETNTAETVTARYLVGCDGPGGMVRDALGIALGGLGVFAHSLNVFFRSPELIGLHDKGRARFHRFIDAEGCWSEMIAIDGDALYRVSVFDDPEIDAATCLRRLFGGDFPHEIIDVSPWERRDFVAGRYRAGRVFIAGDSAHQCSPTGGYGMHTGIEEAMNLAWKLAAALQGWAGPGLLDSYEAERKPIARRNVSLGTDAFRVITGVPAIGEDAAARVAAGGTDPTVDELRANVRSFSGSDYHKFQYAYEDSPVCLSDGTPPPERAMTFTPTARPGMRAPHHWLAEGRSSLDLFGDGFVLMALGGDAPDAAPLADAGQAAGVPLTIEAIMDPTYREICGAALVLVRPDGHVAWRGDACPENPMALIDRVRGAAAG